MTVHWAHGGPSGKIKAGGVGGSAAQERVAGMSRNWSIPGGSYYHTRSLLMRAAPDAFCTEGDNFLLA